MVKQFFFIAIVLTLIGAHTRTAYATAAIASTFPLQITQLVEMIPTNISSEITAAATKASFIDDTIFRPLQTTLITIAQQQAADDILSWVNGGTEGNSLVIADPKQYIKDQGLAAIKDSLKDIPEDSIYGDSIFSAIVDQYQDNDLRTKLAALSKSNIPSMLQENFCSDEALTSYAIKDLGPEYTSDELIAKKTELYNYACEGDPETDPEVAAKLIDLGEQDESIGGWEQWLATTAGDNPYTKTTIAKDLEEENKAEEEENQKSELYDGLGPVSQTKCTEEAPAELEGEEPACEEEEVLTPGEAAGEALSRAANSGLDRLTNLMEGGLTGLLTSLAISKITGGVNSTVKQKGPPTTTVTTTSPPRQDLVGDAATKASIVNPMMRQFDSYKAMLDNLESVDRNYLADVNAYASNLSNGRACLDSLVESGAVNPGNPQVVEAYAYYDDRQNRVDAVKNVILPEIRSITAARNLITSTIALINNSNSTQEIGKIFNEYSTKIDASGYPTTQTEGVRKGEHVKNKNDMERDEVNITKYQNMCTSLGGSTDNGGGSGGI